MNATRRTAVQLIVYAASFLCGIPLFFLARWAEASAGASLLAASLIEESLKGCLFLALWLATRLARERLLALPSAEFLPLICIVGFALTENILYFLEAPTGSIYRRLLYSYPIHLNTAALYTLAFLAGRPLASALAALAGLSYHFALNVLALVAGGPAVYAVGALNLVALAALFLHIHRMRIERSLDLCWTPE
jgi:hypothetical protein